MSNKSQKLLPSEIMGQELISKAIDKTTELIKSGIDATKEIVKETHEHQRKYYETRRKADKEAGVKRTKFKEEKGVSANVNPKDQKIEIFGGKKTEEEIEY